MFRSTVEKPALVFLLFFLSFVASAQTIYVNSAAGGANDGTSWTNAYTNLETALAAAVGGEDIWVAQGVYIPSSIFNIPANVQLYGGFNGTETTIDQRDLLSFQTILSGDVNGDDIITTPYPSLAFGNRADNRAQVVSFNNVGTLSVMDGFVVSGGSNPGSSGGMVIQYCSPTLRNIRFEQNSGINGGGLAIFGDNGFNPANPTLLNCVFTNNLASSNGGAVYITSTETTSTITIVNSTFSKNVANNGGAIYNTQFTGTVVTNIYNSILYGNLATTEGLSLFNTDASTITVNFQNSLFEEINSAGFGGTQVNSNINDLGGNRFNEDPLFLDASNEIFELQDGSPALQAGNVSLLPTDADDVDGDANVAETYPFDINNFQRIQWANVDMGAFENQSIFENALDFDGTDDYVVASLPSPGIYTMEAWVKFDVLGGDMTVFRWTASADPNQVSHWLKLDATGTYFEHYIFDGATKVVQGTTAVSTGVWYHVAITAENGGFMRLYVNGVEEGTPLAVGTLWNAGNQLRIGDRPNTFPYFDGQVDEFRYWGAVRTKSEIINNAYSTLTSGTGLVLSYDFNEGVSGANNATITTVPDITGGGNNGALNGPFALDGASSNWVASTAFLADVLPPTILSATTHDTDLNGQIDLITVNFSEDLTAATVTDPGAEFLVAGYTIASSAMNGTNAIDITLTESGGSDTDQTPVVTLLAATLQDLNGVDNVSETITPEDNAAPALVFSTPLDEDTDVPVGDNIILTFSEPVNQGSGILTLVDTNDGTGTENFSLPSAFITGYGTNTITIDPSADLEEFETYAIQIANTVFEDQSPAINTYPGIADNTTLNFTAGQIQNALNFNGTDGFVSGTGVNISSSDFTVEGWFNTNNATATQTLISIGSSGLANQSFHVRLNNTIVTIGFFSDDVTIAHNVTTGWHHFAVTHNSTTLESTLYIDGALINSDFHISNFTGNSDFNIGKNAWESADYFSGQIDEVRVWGDVRTHDEIYDNAYLEAPSGDNLISQWSANQVSGALVDGISANNGTLNGVTNYVVSTAFDADIFGPKPTLSSVETSPTLASPITVDITFNEPVTGFDLGDIVVGNGSPSNFVDIGDNLNFSVDVTPVSSGEVTVTAVSGGANDAAANPSLDGTFNIIYDPDPPIIAAVTLSADRTRLLVEFDEDVFGAADGITPIDAADFVVNTINAGTASLTYDNTITILSPTSVELDVTVIGTPDGGEIVEVVPANATSIYDLLGTPMSVSQTGNRSSLTDNSILSFDGVDDYVIVPTNAVFELTQYTVEAWINLPDTDPVTAQKNYSIVSKGSLQNEFGANRSGYTLMYGNDGSNNNSFILGHESGSGTTEFFAAVAPLNPDTWYHVAGSFDGTTMRLYLDGSEIGTFNPVNPGVDHGGIALDLKIGAFEGSSFADHFPGKIDEVRIWDSARDPSDILVFKDEELSGTQTGLVAYYDFSEGIGSTLGDVVAGRNGTLTNFDQVGATGTWASGGPFIAPPDVTAPVVTFAENTLTIGTTIITGTVDDLSANIEVSLDGGTTRTPGNNYGDTTWDFDLTTDPNYVGEGFYNLIVYATDAVENEGSTAGNVTIDLQNSLSFDGIDDYAEAPDNASLDITGAITVETWVKFDEAVPATDIPLVSKWNDVGNQRSYVLQLTSSSEILFGVSATGASTTEGTDISAVVTPFSFAVSKWYHIAGVFNPGSSLQVFVNGELVGENTSLIVSSIHSGSSPLAIAAFGNTTDNSAVTTGGAMEMDETRIWSTNLAQTTIQNQITTELTGSESNLVAYYNYDIASGTTLTDLTTNANDLTLYNDWDNATPADGVTNGPIWVPSSVFDADVIAPFFITGYPTITGVGSSGFTITTQFNEIGSLSYVVLTDGATAPGTDDIRGGTGFLGAPAVANGVINVTTPSTDFTANITTLSPSTNYDVYMIGEDDEGVPNVQFNSTFFDVTTATPPLAPTDVIAYASSSTGITIEWTDNATDETGYNVERDTDPAFGAPTLVLNGGPPNLTAFVDAAGADARYYYRVQPTNGNEDASSYSAVEFGTTVSFPASALQFDGINDIVSFSDANLPSGTNPRTVEMWVNGTQQGANTYFFSYGTNTTNQIFAMGFDTSGRLLFTQSGSSFTSSILINDGWHHVALSFNGTTYQMYIDGVADNTSSPTTNTILSGTATIGGFIDNSLYATAIVDEVRVWDFAKTDFSDRFATVDLSIAQPNLVAYFPFDENSGTSTFDNTSNINDGTLAGFDFSIGSDWVTSDIFTDGVVVNTNDSGPGSLRAALEWANASASKETITFNIPGTGPWTISPTSALPTIDNASNVGMIIDGTSQPGWNMDGGLMVTIDGTSAGGGSGFTINEPSVEIYGLHITNFGANGLQINSASSGIVIGSAGNGNVISGNSVTGMTISNVNGGTIQGNRIGTTMDGLGINGNTQQGIRLSSATNITIGGDSGAGEGNLISDNGSSSFPGIQSDAGNSLINIYGNLIGTDRNGDNDLGNAYSIAITSGTNINVGSLTSGHGNVIAGSQFNSEVRIQGAPSNIIIQNNIIGLNSAGNTAINQGTSGVNGVGISVNSTGIEILDNTISGLSGSAVSINGGGITSDTKIRNNFFGTNTLGTGAGTNLANLNTPIYINALGVDNTTNRIEITGNVISGNGDSAASDRGIDVQSSTNILIQGNNIGVETDGTTAYGNFGPGIFFLNATNVEIDNNIIAYNSTDGIYFQARSSLNTGVIISSSNTFFCNGDLGIDYQDPAAVDPPVITSVTSGEISGTSTAADATNINIYQVDASCADNQGAVFIASTTVAGGVWSHTGAINTAESYVAIVNDPSVGLSEFSVAETISPSIVTNTNDTGAGSLRDAIAYANANPGTTITFDIAAVAPWTITLATALPQITAANTIIDGTTQPGWNFGDANGMVHINGSSLGTANGINIDAAGAEVYGLAFTAFNGNTLNGHILLASDAADNAIIGAANMGNVFYSSGGNAIYIIDGDNATIQGNRIGTLDGTTAAGLSSHGIATTGEIVTLTIGGDISAGEGNLISGAGASRYGMNLFGSGGGLSNVTIRGNKIGTNDAATGAIANTLGGINILGTVSAVTIGGPSPNDRNVISGNGSHGIRIQAGNTFDINGNYIGLQGDGSTALQNNGAGIYIDAAPLNVNIGDQQNNQIQYNFTYGIFFATNNSSNTAFGTNIITCNQTAGIGYSSGPLTAQPTITSITPNEATVSTTAADGSSVTIWFADDGCNNDQGVAPIGSALVTGGIATISGAFVVGQNHTATVEDLNGTSEFSAPFVADYIEVSNTNDTGAGSLRDAITAANAAPGSSIYFNIPGGGPWVINVASQLPNITGAGTIIDGTTQTGWNIDAGDMVTIDGSALASTEDGLIVDAASVEIYGMLITQFPSDGISSTALNSGSMIIGAVGKGNVLNNNGARGVAVGWTFASVVGNRIGTNPAGTIAAPNGVGGIGLANSTTVTDNLISGHNGAGDEAIFSNAVGGHTIANNYIGTDVSGTFAIPNSRGIEIVTGGSSTVENNLISGNTDAGIWSNTGFNNNTIRNNIIGLDVSATNPIPNGVGILYATGSGNRIGYKDNPNIIAGNTGAAIQSTNTGSVNNSWATNEIYGNGLGIDLGGANNGITAPSIDNVTATDVSGSGTDGDMIHVYYADASGQGQTFVDSVLVSGGVWSISGLSLTGGEDFVATATNAIDGSSEFSSTSTYIYPYPVAEGAGESISFDGVDDYINLNSLASVMAGNENNFTVEFWAKAPPIYTGTTGGGLISVNSAADANVFLVFSGSTDSGFDNELTLTDSDVREIDGTVWADNTWHHIAYTRNSSLGTLYLDGVQIGTHTADFVFSTDDVWSFGIDIDPPSSTLTDFLTGEVDELRIWSIARTESAIRQTMAQKVSPSEVDLVAYYRMDDSGDAVNLVSIDNQHNGIINGGATYVTSGAHIGDDSFYDYAYLVGDSRSHGNFSMTELGTAGLPLHIYRVFQTPSNNTATGFNTIDDTEYYGVFSPGQTYSARLFYTSVTSDRRLLKRDDLTDATWESASGPVGTDVNDQQIKTPFITGNGQFVSATESVPYPVEPDAGSALSLDGVDDYVQGPDLTGTITNDFTLEAWVKTSTAGAMNIVSIGANATNQGVALKQRTTNQLSITPSGVNGPSSGFVNNDDEWYHVAGVYSGTTLTLYVNGINLGSISTSLSLDYSQFRIGANAADATQPWNGQIDQVRIWNTALSETELRDHMIARIDPDVAYFGNLVAAYQFDDTDPNTAYDVAGSYDGAITGGATKVISGAPKGEGGIYSYAAGPGTLTTAPFGEDVTLYFDDASNGIHAYLINAVPDQTAADGFNTLDQTKYYGLFAPGNPKVDLRMDYNNGGTPDLDRRIVYRDDATDNAASGGWERLSGLLNTDVATDSVYAYNVGTGQATTATLNPASTYPILSSTDPGTSLIFDGTTQYVQLPEIPLDPSTTNWTVELWAKASILTGTQNLLVQEDLNGTGRAYLFLSNALPRTLQGGTDIEGTIALSTDTWHHHAVTYDGVNITIYTDGVQSVQTAATPESTQGAFRIGTSKLGASTFNGEIDEVRIWNEALSQTTIDNFRNTTDISAHPNYPHMLAYYKFDDGTGSSVLEDVFSNNDGTLVSMDPATDWVTSGAMPDAIPANALNFDRVNDYVDLGNPPQLDLGDDITLEAWVYWDGDNTTSQTIVSRAKSGETSADNVLYLFQISANGYVRLFYEYGAGLDVDAYSTTQIPANTWVHVAVTRETGPDTSADTETNFYINGVLDRTIVGQEDPWDGGSGAQLVWIGAANQTGSERYFGGEIDELRIWNIERTPGEIQADFRSTLTGSESGLMAYYSFNQGVAGGTNTGETTLTDLTVNNLDGTLTGFALTGSTSNWVASGAQNSLPNYPTNLIVTEASPTQIDLTWSDNSFDETDFAIFRSDGDDQSFVEIGTVGGADIFTYSDNTVSAEGRYYYYVVARNGSGDSSPTNIRFGSTLTPPGASLDFDGLDDILMVKDNNDFHIGTNDFAIEFWMYSNTVAGTRGIISQTDATASAGQAAFRLAVNWGFSAIQLFTDDGSGAFTYNIRSNTNSIVAGNWHHVAVTRESGVTTIYIDGVDETFAGGTVAADIPNSSADIYIGSNPIIAEYFDVTLDELRVFNGAGLTQSEVQQWMSKEKLDTHPKQGQLVAHYRFDEGTPDANNTALGNSIYDIAGVNNGTMSGFSKNGTATNWVTSGANLGPKSFITTWVTTDGTITIPTNSGSYTYNYDVTWTNLTNTGVGDGSLTAQTSDALLSGLENGSTYQIEITGDFPAIYFNNGTEANKIQTVEQWGDITWSSMIAAFFGCSNLNFNAVDAPILAPATNMLNMFRNATSFNSSIDHWDVSNVTSMGSMFQGASVFNQSLDSWDMSGVLSTNAMFAQASAFNGTIGSWNMGSVLNTSSMFLDAAAFNQDISGWNVSNVVNMTSMFEGAIIFDQPIGSWDVSNVSNMSFMFFGASDFNQDISIWSTTSLTTADAMFREAASFNQPIGSWNTASLTSAPAMFLNASAFDQPLNGWDVSQLTELYSMFENAAIFNQDLSAWDVSLVTDFSFMFSGAVLFNQDLTTWNTSSATDMSFMFSGASAFDQDISGWDVSSITFMDDMLSNSGLSVFNYDAALTGWSGQTLQSGVSLGATGLIYSSSAQSARDILTNSPNLWSIIGDVLQGSPFITTWVTTDGTITIPTNSGSYTYNYDVTWTNLTNTGVGDGSLTAQTGDALLSGLENGSTYQVEISGTFPAIYFNETGDFLKIQSIEQWGDIAWESFLSAFDECSNLVYNATDAPDLTLVTDLGFMFAECASFDGNLSSWDVSGIGNMFAMFRGTSFTNAGDPGINAWDVSSVENFSETFSNTPFNQPIGGWTIHNVNPVIMTAMFTFASNFDQDLSLWDVSQVTDMREMFNATPFNQDISAWNVSNVTDMSTMFSQNSAFNFNISSWTTTSVTTMANMFNGASSFDQDLGGWDVSLVNDMAGMLDNSGMSTTNYDAVLTGWSGQSLQSGVSLGATGLIYSSAAQSSRDILTNSPNFWVITGDVLDTPPNFISGYPAIPTFGEDNFDLEVQQDEEGSAYFVVVPDGDPAPTANEVLFGQSSGGGTPILADIIVISAASTTFSYNVSGLTPNTPYDVYVVGEDIPRNLQASPTLVEVTTLSVAFPGFAIQFDGADDQVLLTNQVQQNWSDFTIEMWVNTPSGTTTQFNFFEQVDDLGGGTPQTIIAGTFNGSPYFFIRETNSGNTGLVNGSTNIADDTWHHVAYVKTGSDLSVYIDGVLDNNASTTLAGGINFPASNVTARFGGNSILDEIKFYDFAKTDFSDRLTPLTGSEANLIGYYNFDEGSGTTAGDLTAGTNTGTLTNFGFTTGSDWVASGPFPAIPIPDVTITTIPLVDANVTVGDADVLIYKYQMDVTGGDITLQGAGFLIAGSVTGADFVASGFDLLYNVGVDDIGTATNIGSSTYGDQPGGIGFLLTETITDGSTAYFYVIADINAAGTPGNVFNVTLDVPAEESFGIADPKNKIDGGLVDGNIFTLQAIPDVTAPTVVNVTPSLTTLADGDSQLEITTEFDEPMDTGIDPTLSFPVEDPAATLTYNSGVWDDNLNFRAIFDIVDANELIPNIDVRIDLGQDAAGNVMAAHDEADVFSIDMENPTVTVDALTTNVASPQLTGTINDNTAAVDVTVNGTGPYSATNNGDGTWTLAATTIAPDLTDGTFEVVAVATDLNGNTGTDASTNELTIDLTAPAVTVNALTTNITSPELTGTVDDNAATIDVTVNGTGPYVATNNGDGTWTLTAGNITPALTDGVFEVVVSATDANGNVGSDATTNELTIDLTAPTVTVDALTTNASSPQLTGTVDDNAATIDVTVNGTGPYAAANNGDGTWTLSAGIITPALTDGVYEVIASGTDALGNTATDATNNELTIDQTAPVVTVDDIATSITSPELTGTVDDIAATLLLTVDGGVYAPANNGDGTWTLTAGTISPDLADGTYDVALTATDALGNAASDVTTDELVISQAVIARTPINVTSTGFTARWSTGLDVQTYQLDISETPDFSTFVSGWENFETTATSVLVTNLDFSTNYYYRVRLVNTSSQVSANSNVRNVKTLFDLVTEADSLALVQIYNAIAPQGLNWETARLRNWDGVLLDLSRTRVEIVNLAGTTAAGEMPNPFTGNALTNGGLSNIQEMNLSNNQISGLMDFSGSSIESLNVQSNSLTFDDLEPLVSLGLSTFIYDNQASIQFDPETNPDFLKVTNRLGTIRIAPRQSPYALSITTGGSANQYNWFKDGAAISSGADYSITGTNNTIISIDYATMGEFSAEVTNTLLPNLTLTVDAENVFAVESLSILVRNANDAFLNDEVAAYLLDAIVRPGIPGYDTLERAENIIADENGYTFTNVVLGDYLLSVDPTDDEQYIPTYFGDAFEWENAVSYEFRQAVTLEIVITGKPTPYEPGDGDGTLFVLIEEDFGDTGGRIDARRRAAGRKCGLKKRRSGGRTDQDEFDLVAYGETDENGEFQFGFLPEGTYRFFVEYPGIPLDESSFVEFQVGEAGISDTDFSLSAFATEDGIEVTIERVLGVILEYFKDLEIYPNPSSEFLNIRYRHLKSTNVTAQLMDIAGNVKWSTDLKNGYDGEIRIDVTDYQEGIYILRMYDRESKDENVVTFRVIVSKR